MLEKAKQKFDSMKEERTKKKAEKERMRLEAEAEELRIMQERLAQEREVLETEKNRLLQLDDKALMVELIFAVRGFHEEFTTIKGRQNELENDLADMNSRLDLLADDIESLESKVYSSGD